VDNVLGLARTGLIFTGLQEGAQLGGGGSPHLAKQSPVFSIPSHVMSRWVPVGGAARWELTHGSGGCGAGPVRESGSVVRVCILFSPYLYRCCSCSLCFLFC